MFQTLKHLRGIPIHRRLSAWLPPRWGVWVLLLDVALCYCSACFLSLVFAFLMVGAYIRLLWKKTQLREAWGGGSYVWIHQQRGVTNLKKRVWTKKQLNKIQASWYQSSTSFKKKDREMKNMKKEEKETHFPTTPFGSSCRLFCSFKNTNKLDVWHH